MKNLFKNLLYTGTFVGMLATTPSCNSFEGDDVLLNTCPKSAQIIGCSKNNATNTLTVEFQTEANPNTDCLIPKDIAVNVPGAANRTVSSGAYTAANNAPLQQNNGNQTFTVTIPNPPANPVLEILQMEGSNTVSDVDIPVTGCSNNCTPNIEKECVSINGMDATVTWKLELCDSVGMFVCICNSGFPLKPDSKVKRNIHNADGSIQGNYWEDPSKAMFLPLTPGQYFSVELWSNGTINPNANITLDVISQFPANSVPTQKVFPVNDSDCNN